MFFAPAAGSTFMSLVGLARSLRPRRPFFCFECTELEGQSPAPESIEDIAAACVAEIQAIQRTGPYYLGGHCWGGTLAFDIAAKLESKGEAIAVLLLLETFPSLCAGSRRERVGDASDPPSSHPAGFHQAMETIAQQVLQQISRLPEQLADRIGRLSWNQLSMGDRYRAKPIDAPLALFRTSTHSDSLFHGWRHFTNGAFTERIVPGSTFSMLNPPYLGVLCTELEKALTAASADQP